MPHANAGLMERARRALDKPARVGDDIDLRRYTGEAPERPGAEELASLPMAQQERLRRAGIDTTETARSGSLLVMDRSVVHRRQNVEDLEIIDVMQALDKYPELEEYWWKAVQVDVDKFTAQAALDERTQGYFVRARPGARSTFPLQTCLYIGTEGSIQNVHNLIIAEEGSELNIISGCAVDLDVRTALHVGISEMYVKKGAKLTFTMIHNWAEQVEVRPRTSVIVEEGGQFVSNYVLMQPVRNIQTYPSARLVGEGAVATFSSIILGTPGSHIDVGGRVLLQAPRTRAEIISRAISSGGTIIARGHLSGEATEVRAHLECRGLMLRDEGAIVAIPELGTTFANVDMSHEAAVGRIARDEIEYLMARGLSEEEATSIIIKGFLNVRIEGLPSDLQADLEDIIQAADVSGL